MKHPEPEPPTTQPPAPCSSDPARRGRRALRNLAFGLVALAALAGGATQACSSVPLTPQHPATPPPGVQTPLAPPQAPVPARVAEPGSDPIDLDAFKPLLSQPELASAARAYESEDYRLAAERIVQAMQATALSALDEPRWYLLLARAEERAGLLLEAEVSYAKASASAWPLSDYAALGWGRALLARAEVQQGEQVLDGIPASGAPFAEAQILLADSRCQRGEREACADHLEAFLGFATRPRGWSLDAMRVLNELLAATPSGASSPEGDAQLGVRALRILRAVMIEAPRDAQAAGAREIERRILADLPPALAEQHRLPSLQDQLRQLRAQTDGRDYRSADETATALLARLSDGYGETGCEARVLQAKALGAQKKWTAACERIDDLLAHCKNEDLRARSLYMAGKYAFSDRRYTVADRLFAQLEREAPDHTLADDARLHRAEAQQELGVESRFTELLTRMPEDYPKGDMVLEGVFRLALRRIQKSDWAGAAVILERGTALAAPSERSRSPGDAGREHYFLARALIETGESERGLKEYEAIIREQPLSYYMLHAYSRLVERDPERARRALEAAQDEHDQLPFSIGQKGDLARPAFIRVAELIRQSDIDSARRELALMDVAGAKASPELWWGVALLYARAGSAQLSHQVTRWRVKNWLERWPVGAWRQAWELAFPRPHLETVLKEAEQNQLDPALVYAIMREESAFDAGAVSPANAYGLMQLMQGTARGFGKLAGVPTDTQALKTPRVNITLGTRVLANYMARFPQNVLLGIPSYNAGPGRPMRWIKDFPSVDFDVWVELIPFRETRMYTKRVLQSRGAYRFLYYADGSEGDPLLLPEQLLPTQTPTVPALPGDVERPLENARNDE
jgi:soluble lytic murein transglycosylase